jgi:glycosyltransferase involved in cell wall biosynthesis
MPPLVTIDARDAGGPELRGWGRYAACLIGALREANPADLDLDILDAPVLGPEIAFEQLRLPLHLRRRGAALVHATNCFLPLARPCPGVVTIHDLAFETWPGDFATKTRWKYRALTRAAARSARRIICPSDFTRDDVCERYGVKAEKIAVIPEAPALPLGDEPPPPGPYVIAVGDLRQKKNLGALVRAFAGLHGDGRASGHRLVLAGVDSGEGRRLRELAGGAEVELTGYVSDARLDALIRGAAVLVHPSLYEGFGLVVLEAMARGVPVVAAGATALPQTGGDAALYFDPHSGGGANAGDGADALAEVLAPLLSDPHARAERARAGLEHAARFSWATTAELTLGVYREAL